MYLKRVVKFPENRKVYVLGMEGIEDELDAEGIQHVGGTVSEGVCVGSHCSYTCCMYRLTAYCRDDAKRRTLQTRSTSPRSTFRIYSPKEALTLR